MSDQKISNRSINFLPLLITASVAVLGIAAIIFVLLSTRDDSTNSNETDNTIVELPTLPPAAESIAGTAIDPPQDLTDFTMPANSGEDLSLSDLQGDYILTYFGYTRCPDVCPATLLKYRRIKQALGDDADNVTFMFISVDGQRDQPEDLNRYLQRYDPEFIGLSGTDEVLQPIQNEYGLFYERRENTGSDAGYLVDHTASSFLIDPEGRLIRVYSFTEDAAAITEDLQSLINSEDAA